jgi:chromosome segregation ATPase
LEYSQLLAKSEDLKKELYSESQKYQNLSSNVSFLSQENEILQQELENLQDFIKESQLTHSTLKARLSELSVPSLNSSMEDNISSLKEYSFKLEAKINELTQKLSSNPGISRLATIKANLESKVKNLEEKLKECQEFAMKSRADVAEAITEIEHYAHLLNVLEEKMNETEEKVLICLREKEFAAEELKEVKDEYFGMIARR